jgi:hypothetical protein
MPQRNYGQIVAQKNPKVLTAEPYVFNESLRCVMDEQSIHRLNRSGHNIARENHAACLKNPDTELPALQWHSLRSASLRASLSVDIVRRVVGDSQARV